MYMVPPFLAYYGVMTQNQSLVAEAYNQIRLYRSYLLDPDTDNLWRHIDLGSWADDGHWSTGTPLRCGTLFSRVNLPLSQATAGQQQEYSGSSPRSSTPTLQTSFNPSERTSRTGPSRSSTGCTATP